MTEQMLVVYISNAIFISIQAWFWHPMAMGYTTNPIASRFVCTPPSISSVKIKTAQ